VLKACGKRRSKTAVPLINGFSAAVHTVFNRLQMVANSLKNYRSSDILHTINSCYESYCFKYCFLLTSSK